MYFIWTLFVIGFYFSTFLTIKISLGGGFNNRGGIPGGMRGRGGRGRGDFGPRDRGGGRGMPMRGNLLALVTTN